MTELREIVGWRISEVSTWHKIPVVPDSSPWPEAVAEQLADGEWARRRVAENLRREHVRVIDEPDSHLMAGIWVPDRATGEIAAVMYLDWLIPGPGLDPVTRDGYRALVDPDRRRDIDVRERSLSELDLPAGPALMTREIIARGTGLLARRKVVQENVIYTVFPPGCRDAVQFTCSTELLHLGDAMAADAAVAIETLHVDLSDAAR